MTGFPYLRGTPSNAIVIGNVVPEGLMESKPNGLGSCDKTEFLMGIKKLRDETISEVNTLNGKDGLQQCDLELAQNDSLVRIDDSYFSEKRAIALCTAFSLGEIFQYLKDPAQRTGDPLSMEVISLAKKAASIKLDNFWVPFEQMIGVDDANSLRTEVDIEIAEKLTELFKLTEVQKRPDRREI